MHFTSINSTKPRKNPWKFHEKILRIGGAGNWGFFESAILIFFFAKKNLLLHLNENKQPIHMRYHLSLHFRILEKTSSELICTRLYLSFPNVFFVGRIMYEYRASKHCLMILTQYWYHNLLLGLDNEG
jgi:hypothetical protein